MPATCLPIPADARRVPLLDHPALVDASYAGVFPEEPYFYHHLIEEEVGGGAAVLEAGVGLTLTVEPLARLGHRLTAVVGERPAALKNMAQLKNRGITVDSLPQPIHDFTAPAAAFDAFISPLGFANVLWSEDDLLGHFRSAARAVRKGGVGIFTVGAAEDLDALYPHQSTWATSLPALETHSCFGFDRSPSHGDDIARFYHLTAGHDADGWVLGEWYGLLRVFTPTLIRRLSVLCPQWMFLGWYRPFTVARPLRAPLNEDGAAVAVFRRV